MLNHDSMGARVASHCFHDVSMNFIHARVDGLIGRILELVLHA